jgi:hypothetical protein
MRNNPKLKKSFKTIIKIDNVDYDLGTLYTTTQGYCTATKKNVYTFKCLLTGKSFTDINLLSDHIVKTLISTKRVVLS